MLLVPKHALYFSHPETFKISFLPLFPMPDNSTSTVATPSLAQTSPTSTTSQTAAKAQQQRSTRFAILKAIAIICVVLSHAGIRGWLFNFVFIFHVPVFFLCAGYFFHLKYLNDERTFLAHRIKGLYVPFWKWSVIFLVLHNLFFHLGILSEQYGNASGGVTHPFTWHQFCQNLWSITVNMSGYDQFLCGTFWFFRALLVASIGFLIVFKIVERIGYCRTRIQSGWTMLIIGLLLTLWKVAEGVSLTGIAQGGYRELMGFTFMAAGFLLAQYRITEWLSWKIAAPCLVLLVLASIFFPSSMVWNASLTDFFSLPIPAVAAFVALIYACGWIDRTEGFPKRTLVYIGNNTLYIFAFHLAAFKVISAMKVAFYGLPWEAVGGHPTVVAPASNVLWILLYTIAGIGIPLAGIALYRHFSPQVHITEHQLINVLRFLVRGTVSIVLAIGLGIAHFFQYLWRSFLQMIKEISDASSTKDE